MNKRRLFFITLLALLTIAIAVNYVFFHKQAFSKESIVHINSGRADFSVFSSALKISDLLKEQGLKEAGAFVKPSLDESVYNGMRIVYRPPVQIQISDNGVTKSFSTSRETVGDVLEEKQIVLGPKDEIAPALDKPISGGLRVEIQRVQEIEETRQEPIPFSITDIGDPGMLYGQQAVEKGGKDGLREVVYKVKLKGGKEVLRKILSTKILRAAQTEVLRVGRKIVIESYEIGRASWYVYKKCLCAAHPFFSRGSYLRITNLANDKSVIVRVNDVGPDQDVHMNRILDLDAEAFKLLAPLSAGTMDVRVEKLKTEE